MKRCPRCEFIYEDDQSACDMDGVGLVVDSKLLPATGNSVGILVASSRAAQWKSFALPAAGAVILGAVLFLVYYVSTQQTAPQNIHYSSAQVIDDSKSGASVSAPNAQPATPPSIAAEPTPSTTESIEPSASEARRSSAPSVTPATKREEKKRKQDRPIQKSNNTNSKKDSKIGSFLKKAGNVLKKPFKL